MIPDDELRLIEPQRLAACRMDEARAQERQWVRQNRRPRAFTLRDVGRELKFETLVITSALLSHLHGAELTEADVARLIDAQRNIDHLIDEATR